MRLSDSKVFFIAGDYTPHAGQTRNGATVISCQTPLARELIDKASGETVTMGRRSLKIEKIDA